MRSRKPGNKSPSHARTFDHSAMLLRVVDGDYLKRTFPTRRIDPANMELEVPQ